MARDVSACGRSGVAACYHQRYRVGRVAIEHNWDSYQRRLAKSHRQGMRRSLLRLASHGNVRFEIESQMPEDKVEPWLQTAFEVENRGWKGEAGTSVLQTPGMSSFFVKQMRQLARWGQLETASLRLDGRMVAFVLGCRARSFYFANKISYAPEFAAFSPGQLLFHHILERLHEDRQIEWLDFMGPMTQAMMRWRPKTYGLGRMVAAPSGWLAARRCTRIGAGGGRCAIVRSPRQCLTALSPTTWKSPAFCARQASSTDVARRVAGTLRVPSAEVHTIARS